MKEIYYKIHLSL
ncbi:hypothetical protein DMN91_003901, partial [Ooceraea biroi]